MGCHGHGADRDVIINERLNRRRIGRTRITITHNHTMFYRSGGATEAGDSHFHRRIKLRHVTRGHASQSRKHCFAILAHLK